MSLVMYTGTHCVGHAHSKLLIWQAMSHMQAMLLLAHAHMQQR